MNIWQKLKSMANPNPWIYQGRVLIGSLIGDNYGFVYCITNTITKKSILVENTSGKSENLGSKGDSSVRRRVTSESNWRDYWGSCPELLRRILGDMGLFSSQDRYFPSTPL